MRKAQTESHISSLQGRASWDERSPLCLSKGLTGRQSIRVEGHLLGNRAWAWDVSTSLWDSEPGWTAWPGARAGLGTCAKAWPRAPAGGTPGTLGLSPPLPKGAAVETAAAAAVLLLTEELFCTL